MKRLLITGGSGYLGGRLVEQARETWDVIYTWFQHPVHINGANGFSLDITDNTQVIRLFQDTHPQAVIHTAYSQDNLSAITTGTKNIVHACETYGARLLHLSTDAVFDGQRGGYREDETPAPVHPYGRAKAESERLVAAAGGLSNTTIIRTSLIWGLNPIDTRTLYLKKKLEKGDNIILFKDEYRCPVLVTELATAILEILCTAFSGIIHVAGPESLNRYEFGMKLAHKLELNPAGISPGLSRESGMLRPLNCSLDTTLARRLLHSSLSSPSSLL